MIAQKALNFNHQKKKLKNLTFRHLIRQLKETEETASTKKLFKPSAS